MLELKDWAAQAKFPDNPWLVLGKGPSFGRRNEYDLTNFNTFSLNHVVREQRVDVAHIVDIDVVEPCGQALLHNCTWLIMPRCPHVNCFASEYMQLIDWINCIPILAEKERQGKLVTYSLLQELSQDPDPWTIETRYFSSEAALGILAKLGVKTIRSLGIDGGTTYSSNFNDVSKSTLLANHQPSFDLQFARFAEICKRHNLDYMPLSKPSEILNATDSIAVPASTTVDDKIPDISDRSNNDQTTAATPDQVASGAYNHLSTVAKIQKLEGDLRSLRFESRDNNELLYYVTKELSVLSQRLGWANDEIKEYREHILELERQANLLVRSKTWKIGRLFSKPLEILWNKLSLAKTERQAIESNSRISK
jgi:hypothetical protein